MSWPTRKFRFYISFSSSISTTTLVSPQIPLFVQGFDTYLFISSFGADYLRLRLETTNRRLGLISFLAAQSTDFMERFKIHLWYDYSRTTKLSGPVALFKLDSNAEVREFLDKQVGTVFGTVGAD